MLGVDLRVFVGRWDCVKGGMTARGEAIIARRGSGSLSNLVRLAGCRCDGLGCDIRVFLL
jgi:hypothetical protein